MDLSELKKLIRMFEESKISELELEREGSRVRMSKGGAVVAHAPAIVHHVAPAHAPAAPAAGGQPEAATQESESKNHIVRSPIVGTFYRAPSPTNPPYVEEGDIVQKGDRLCIIEAMKLMNEIESDAAGRIVKICAENGKPVEFNQPLFEIAPL
ncbi:MAG: acetyl-CoA carboxylase biotin carboxyl carrier protein [Nitrospinae bacterium]|nr:acetyl-CoA carboxylase biotin carboxyl carrier protein [Nitrospinota bacterium]